MANVAVLGACIRLLHPDGLRYLEEAIGARMGAAAERNVIAARDGYDRCTRQRTRPGDPQLAAAIDAARIHGPRSQTPRFPVSTLDSYAIKTGSWSLDRPVLSSACNACALCALFCPEGAILREDGSITIDYVHCKGCGICEEVCPVRNAISMEEVPA
jgi:pyruvate ferredoxin oxidoreductase delta subunit